MPRLFLIDGSSQMYRAFFAMQGKGLTWREGKSTHAVYIFVTMLRKLIADNQPEFIAASFDLPGPTFRDDLVSDYKANRRPMPSELGEQIPWVHEACEAMGVPILTSTSFEADDVIGTLAVQARDAGFDVAIVTLDKDFFQLVGHGIRVFNPREEGTWYDAEGVLTKFGVRPDQVVDVMALMGDTIDNIKGVPGIGEKGARTMISEHGSLDAAIAAAPGIAKKAYQALLEHVDDAHQSRELARIRTDVPVTFDPNAVRYRGPDREHCFRLFSSLGFRTLLADFAPTAKTTAHDYAVVTSLAEVDELVDAIRQSGQMSLGIVTPGTSAVRAEIVGWAISPAPGVARYLPLAHSGLQETPNLPEKGVFDRLRPLLENAEIAKVVHDVKFAMIVCARAGITLRGARTDTMIASYLLDATRSNHLLEALALERLNYKALSEEEMTGKGTKSVGLDAVPPSSLLPFAAERSDLPLALEAGFVEELKKESLDHVYHDLEEPLIPVLAAIEQAGVKVDAGALAEQGRAMQNQLDALSMRIFEMAGGEFNINSPKQLSEVLFERLSLQAGKKTGKTRVVSTAIDVLEELALTHEVPGLVLKWRSVQKLKGTYVDALPELVNPSTGRVHTTFNQAVAATGRLSSSDPNLQNIPIRTAMGREIRRAFVAEPGHVLISADYSQIELRVLAHLSGDSALVEAFRGGIDIHDRTAERVFGVNSGLDPHELRRRAKIINYALLYGKTAFTLAKDIGVTQTAAQEFIDAYFAGFPDVRAYIDRTLAEARATGVVKTMFGRRRLVPELLSKNGMIRSAAERETVNMPIQGTAADILKKAMIAVHADLEARNASRPRPSRMILTVHDELLFEAPEGEADDVSTLVSQAMERAVALNVPLTVDVGVGHNWKEAKP